MTIICKVEDLFFPQPSTLNPRPSARPEAGLKMENIMPAIDWLKKLFKGKAPRGPLQQGSEQGLRLDSLEQLLQKMNKRERRQIHLVESMRDELTHKVDALHAKIGADLPYETICPYAEHFALYFLHRQGIDPDLDRVWSAFVNMLQSLDIELILDQGKPFDDARHQVCDTRSVPGHPEGAVLEVVRPGMLIQGRLRQYALVIVNKPGEGNAVPDPSRSASQP
jgi:molecular chaperone GrpE (heat shock protein)